MLSVRFWVFVMMSVCTLFFQNQESMSGAAAAEKANVPRTAGGAAQPENQAENPVMLIPTAFSTFVLALSAQFEGPAKSILGFVQRVAPQVVSTPEYAANMLRGLQGVLAHLAIVVTITISSIPPILALRARRDDANAQADGEAKTDQNGGNGGDEATSARPVVKKLPGLVQDIDNVSGLPLYTWVWLSALETALNYGSTWQERYYVPGQTAYMTLELYVAINIIHVFYVFVKEGDYLTYKVPMLIHHALSLASYMNGLRTGRLVYMANVLALCEITTVALCFVFILKDGLVGSGGLVQTGLAVFGGLSWLLYVVFRIVLFPAFLYFYINDILQLPDDEYAKVSNFEKYFYTGTILFLFAASCMWFGQITKGALKVLGYGSKKKQKTE